MRGALSMEKCANPNEIYDNQQHAYYAAWHGSNLENE